MYSFRASEHFEEILNKLAKKDKQLYDRIFAKIHEILNSYDVEHYKNLQYNMKDSKRVHIGHFVLVFQYNKEKNEILFDDFDHHDTIYKKIKN